MKTLKDFDFQNKRVLVRCDFNIPLNENGEISDDFRIKKTLPTIEYLIKHGAKIILMAHLGEPDGKVAENLRLTSVQKRLEEYLKISVRKTEDCVGEETTDSISKMQPGEVLLLENLRFHLEEKNNEENFARELAKLGDIFINDAFGACHRAHASVAGLPKFLPSGVGFLLEEEVKTLSRVLGNPEHPLVVIIGGAKIESKIKVIRRFLEIGDHLLLGGKIANAILRIKGIWLGEPLPEEKAIKELENVDLTSTKLHLPVDVLASLDKSGQVSVRQSAPAEVGTEELLLDIGPETINIFSQIIQQAKTILWTGPLGFFENEKFAEGTRKIAEAIAENKSAFSVLGGGDTLSAISQFNLQDKFSYVSTGGGAMLTFLSGEKMPGLAALQNGEPRSVSPSGKR